MIIYFIWQEKSGFFVKNNKIYSNNEKYFYI